MPKFSHYRPCVSEFFSLVQQILAITTMFNYSAALVTIAAVDFDQLLDFYSVLLQQAPQPYQPQVYGGFKVAGLDLGIFKPKASNTAEFRQQQGGGAISLCLSVDNLEVALAHLADAGYPQTSTVLTASHGRELYIYDPDGNRVILHQGARLTSSVASEPL
jgi:predicted enzyme related to lactoylglutathione lyase